MRYCDEAWTRLSQQILVILYNVFTLTKDLAEAVVDEPRKPHLNKASSSEMWTWITIILIAKFNSAFLSINRDL